MDFDREGPPVFGIPLWEGRRSRVKGPPFGDVAIGLLPRVPVTPDLPYLLSPLSGFSKSSAIRTAPFIRSIYRRRAISKRDLLRHSSWRKNDAVSSLYILQFFISARDGMTDGFWYRYFIGIFESENWQVPKTECQNLKRLSAWGNFCHQPPSGWLLFD